ncbi:hypothetical protein V8J82_11370 [Gymnodinialimonas sp. 2305UL16-5]|uniref:hypothetical protein n=1 Tax=Gymnodinialimonas mytili TaxID=3126503 RepID=UPI00309932BD
MKAVIFGSLNAICDLSEIERQAFNQAFSQSGLPWHWDARTYRDMSLRLTEVYEPSSPDHATARDVNLDELLDLKDEILFNLIEDHSFVEDPLIVGLFDYLRRKRMSRGLISQQSRLIVNSVRAALPGILASDFSSVTCRGDEGRPETRQCVYADLASTMRVELDRCIAIETTRRGIETARAAGVGHVVAYRVPITKQQKASGVVAAADDLLATLKSLHWTRTASQVLAHRATTQTVRILSATAPERRIRTA